MSVGYPRHIQIADAPIEVDGYVAASHHPKSISSNAFELRDRRTDEPLAPAEAHSSRDISSQERGILRGIIALLQMCGDDSNLNLYTTSETAVAALKGKHVRRKNLDLLDEIFRIQGQKRIDLKPFYVTAHQVRQWIVLEKLRVMAKDARDKWLGQNAQRPSA